LCGASQASGLPTMQADPESMPANDVTHEFSITYTHAGVDSGSASDIEPKRFAESEDVSNTKACWRPPGMTKLDADG